MIKYQRHIKKFTRGNRKDEKDRSNVNWFIGRSGIMSILCSLIVLMLSYLIF